MTLLTKNIATMKVEAQAHIAADAVVGGQYWEPADNDVGGRGCFLGCLTHSHDPRILEERFGFPTMLTRVVENIFDGLPAEEQSRFFGDIPDAIDCDGKDLTRVVWSFIAEELRGLPSVPENIQAVIDPVIAGMDILASGGEWSPKDARDAYRAADSAAARAAALAAEYLAASAYVASFFDAEAAHYADSAIIAAARAAAESALANPKNARQRQAATILRLIKEAPVVQGEEV